jgi:hypothetical protein
VLTFEARAAKRKPRVLVFVVAYEAESTLGEVLDRVPIPTYYSDEICRVNGLKYARDVVRTTCASRLHQLNVFYDRKFDIVGQTNAHDDLKLGYRSSHTMALEATAGRPGPGHWLRPRILR